MTTVNNFKKLASFYNVDLASQETQIQNCPALLSVIDCDRASKNKNFAPFHNMMFSLVIFGYKPFMERMIPPGFEKEELSVSIPLPLYGNNSYDSSFTNKAYSVIEPSLRRAFPNIPIFLQNWSGKVYLSLMLNPNNLCYNNEVSTSIINTIINNLSEIKRWIERNYN